MKSSWVAITVITSVGSAHADRQTPVSPRYERYIGASLELSNGFDGASEFGLAVQAAPLRHLELELGAIRHDIEGRESDTWLATAAARVKKTFRRAGLFAGLGVVTGEHVAANGCSASGFIDFCGGEDTFVSRHWERAVWLRPELGGEVSLGPVAFRFAAAPVFQLVEPDSESGCIECNDGEQNIVFSMGLHGRIPL